MAAITKISFKKLTIIFTMLLQDLKKPVYRLSMLAAYKNITKC